MLIFQALLHVYLVCWVYFILCIPFSHPSPTASPLSPLDRIASTSSFARQLSCCEWCCSRHWCANVSRIWLEALHTQEWWSWVLWKVECEGFWETCTLISTVAGLGIRTSVHKVSPLLLLLPALVVTHFLSDCILARVSWNLNVILICVSLVASESQHFSCFYWHSVFISGLCVCAPV